MTAVLHGERADRVPRLEVWIDALLEELGQPDTAAAHANLGQDGVMLPGRSAALSAAGGNGVDVFGRVWKNGKYAGGLVHNGDDLAQYTPDMNYAAQFFDDATVKNTRETYPHHLLFYGTHIGPFMQAYLCMGFERFFMQLKDDRAFVHKVLEARTTWAIAMYQKAIDLGAGLIVMGDDAAYKGGPMISPQMWDDIILPYHRRIVEALDVPVIWHSDGHIVALLPYAVKAGFAGVHGIEPGAGMDLAQVKELYGRQLVLVGNIDVRLLCGNDLAAVRRDVRRCMDEGAPGGSYMIT